MDSTVVKAFTLLEGLARSDVPRGISDLARGYRLSKSNVHRLLQTLTRLGYVQPDGGGRYVVTLKVWELGTRVISRVDVGRLARPVMERLTAETQETVHLSVLDHAASEIVYVDKIESQHPIRAYSEVGGRAPAHCVATGKALLAHQPAAVVEGAAQCLTASTPRTIRSTGELHKQLAQIRQQGYAVNYGEWREQVRGIARAIWDANRVPVAAIGISGPADRFGQRSIQRFVPSVLRAADDISRALGGVPPVLGTP